MKKIWTVILVFSCIFIMCEKEEKQVIEETQIYNPPDIVQLLESKGFDMSRGMIRTRSNESSTSKIERQFLVDPCVDGPIPYPMEIIESVHSYQVSDGVCAYRIYADLRENENVNITLTLRGNGDIWNCFFDAYSDCGLDIQPGEILIVGEGESNFSPAQGLIVAKYDEDYFHEYEGFPFPLFGLEIVTEGFSIYVIENLDYQDYKGSFCVEELVPIIYVLPTDAFEVGDKIEYFLQE